MSRRFLYCLVVLCLIAAFVTSCDSNPVHVHVSDDGIVTTEATCTKEGEKAYSCKECGAVLRTEKISALGHAYEYKHDDSSHWEECTRCSVRKDGTVVSHTFSVTTTATCTEDGTKTTSCSLCNYQKTEEDKKIGHDIVNHEAKAATCTTFGWEAYDTCSRCDYTSFKEIAALGHSYSHHEAKAATCLDTGWNAYDACTREGCGYTTKVEIKALGHDYEGGTVTRVEATCTTPGSVTGMCSRCSQTQTSVIEVNPDAHLYGSTLSYDDDSHFYECSYCKKRKDEAEHKTTVTITYTCTKDGTKTTKCSHCSYVKTESVKATGHTYSDEWSYDENNHWHAALCGDPVSKDKAEHVWVEDAEKSKAASCTDNGVKAYVCSICKAARSEKIDAGHTPSAEWNKDENDHWHKCTVCNEDVSRTVHAFNTVKEKKDATAEEAGYTIYECECGKTKRVDIPKAGWESNENFHWYKGEDGSNNGVAEHDWGDEVTVKAVTCTEDGETKTICNTCGYEKKKALTKTGHNYYNRNYGIWSSDGKEHWYACANDGCDAKLDSAVHIEKTETTATCTEGGTETTTCQICKSVIKTVEVSALEHDYENSVWQNLANTYHSRRCARCSKTWDTEAHDFNEEITTEPTCAAAGTKTRTCKVCGGVYTESIAATGNHKWDDGVVTTEAGCSTNGKKTFTCTVCNKTRTESIPAEHKYENFRCTSCGIWGKGPSGGYVFYDCDADNTKDAGGNESAGPDGLMSSVCGWRFLEAAEKDIDGSVCFGFYRPDGANLSVLNGSEDYTAIGMGYKNTIALVSAMGSAACTSETETGTTDSYAARLCYVYKSPALSDADNDWFLPSLKELQLIYSNLKQNGLGGFDENGYWSSSEASSLSAEYWNFYQNRGSNTIKHAWNLCRPVRAFTVCEESVNHTWSEKTAESSSATCTENGKRVYCCTVCNAEKTVVIAKSGHDYEDIEEKEPTCTEVGWDAYKKCRNCSFSVGYNEKKATGHTSSDEYGYDSDYHWYKCAVCGGKGDTSNKHIISSDWTTEAEATCTEDGKKTSPCVYNCGYKKEEVISAKGHTYGYTSASCDESGHSQICSVCGDVTAKEAHELEFIKVVAEATCAQEGKKLMECKVCTRGYYVSIPKTPHVFETAWSGDDDSHWYKCTNTKCSEKSSCAVHDWDEGEVTKVATCTEKGEKILTCNTCGREKTVEIAVDPDNHNFNTESWGHDTTSHWNYTSCGHSGVTGNKAVHNWADGDTITTATCTKEGEKYQICTVCGYKTRVTVSATGHTYVDYKCTSCGIWGKGPSGGYVFYDCDADNTKDGAGPDGLMSSVCGWRFLEAAPSDLEKNYPFGYYRTGDTAVNETVGTEEGIGKGQANTAALVLAMGSTAYTSSSGSEKGVYAAAACDGWTCSSTETGVSYSDWFLPSMGELNLMCENLYKKNLGSFKNGTVYLSSSEYDDTHVNGKDFSENDKPCQRDSTVSTGIRPIRAFK